MPMIENNHFIICIDRCWSDEVNLCVDGWAFAKDGGSVDFSEMEIDGIKVVDWSRHERPDVVEQFRHYNPNLLCGFTAYAALGERTRKITLGDSSVNFTTERGVTNKFSTVPSADGVYEAFCTEVNQRKFTILELGSRVVGSPSRRSDFNGARQYIGFDYHHGENVDVVGDAHSLSKIIGLSSVDAIFSSSVLEHIIMPWVVSAEIHKVLRIDGIALIDTPFVWPSHERPWDFWRYTDCGLRVLFSEYFGWKIERAGMSVPVSVHADSDEIGHVRLPWEPSFGASRILVRKIRDFDWEKFRWDQVKPSELYGGVYPVQSFNGV